MDEESQVQRFVEMVLQSPVDQEHRDNEGPRYFLGFRLADGTSVVRSFWPESGELWRGIMTDPIVASMVSSAVPAEPAVLEALKNIAKDPMARIAERALTRIHRRRASGQCPEVDRGCSCESGIMVLKQQSRPQNKEHPIDATTQPSRSHPNRV